MVKNKITVGIVLAAGVLISVGTGALKYQMSQVQANRQVSTMERKVSDTGESVLVTDELADTEKETEPKVLLEGKEIYIPESAEYEGVDIWGYQIRWNGYNICYYKDSIEEKESDLSIGDAILIARDTVLHYGKKDVSNATVQIFLDIQKGIEEWTIDNWQNYGIRYYGISFRDVAEHCYTVYLNAITGEVFYYWDSYEVESSQMETYYQELEAVEDIYSQELEAVEDIYYPLAKTFIQEELQLGKVEKCYGVMQTMMPRQRPAVSFHCETEDGDLVNISFDQEQKTVNVFSINPLVNSGF